MGIKKVKMSSNEAGIILANGAAIATEYELVIENSYYLLGTLKLFDNIEVCNSHDGMIIELTDCNLLNKYPKIANQLFEILHLNKDKISIKQLIKVKTLFEEIPTILEINYSNHFNKLKAIKNNSSELVKVENQAIESIKNIRFLTNRIIQLINSKI